MHIVSAQCCTMPTSMQLLGAPGIVCVEGWAWICEAAGSHGTGVCFTLIWVMTTRLSGMVLQDFAKKKKKKIRLCSSGESLHHTTYLPVTCCEQPYQERGPCDFSWRGIVLLTYLVDASAGLASQSLELIGLRVLLKCPSVPRTFGLLARHWRTLAWGTVRSANCMKTLSLCNSTFTSLWFNWMLCALSCHMFIIKKHGKKLLFRNKDELLLWQNHVAVIRMWSIAVTHSIIILNGMHAV